ncbi:MAG TPA: polysaccharide biosynthesis C-terminal domain-containing protein [Gemmatimonadaceae bacterium]
MSAPPSTWRAAPLAAWEIARQRLTGPGASSSAIRSLAVNVAGAGISFAGQIVLAHSLGQTGFGVYLFALAVMNAVLVLGKLELDVATTRFLPAYLGSREWSLAKGFIRWSRRTVFGASLLVSGAGALIVLLIRDRLVERSPFLPGALVAACLLLVTSAQLMLNGGQLQSLRWYVASLWPGTVLRPLLLAMTIAILYLASGDHPSPRTAVLVNTGATILAVILTARSLRRVRPPEMRAATTASDKPTWARATPGFVALGIGQLVLSQQADLIVVGSLVNVTDSALYGAASAFAFLVLFGQSSVNFVMAPMIADLHARNEHDRLQGLLRSVFTANAAVTLPVLAVLIALGPWLLRLYGSAYVVSYPVMVILCTASAVVALVGATAGFVLTMTVYQQQAAWIIGGSAAVNIALTILLTPRFGIIGTATATLLATLLRCVLLVVFVRRRLNLSVIPTWRARQ